MEESQKMGLLNAKGLKQASELDCLLEQFVANLEKKLQHMEYWPELKWEEVSI